MEKAFENYQNCLTTFYKKILRSHPKKLALFESFVKTRDSFEKLNEKKQDFIYNIRSKSKEFDDSKSISGASNRSHSKSYKSVKNIDLKSLSTQYLYLASKFSTAFIYSYIYHLFGSEKEDAFNKLIDQTCLIFESNPKNAISQKQIHYWKKIKQLYPNKKKVRWEKLLGDFLSRLSSLVQSNILRGIFSTNSHVKKIFMNKNNFSELHPTDQNLKIIAHFYKLNINYFQCEDGEIVKSSTYIGDRKLNIWISKMRSDAKFACFDKEPIGYNNIHPEKFRYTQSEEMKTLSHALSSKEIQSEKSLEFKKSLKSTQDLRQGLNSSDCKSDHSESSRLSTKSRLGKKRVLRGIQSILREYAYDTQKLHTLEILKQSNAKEQRIKKVLSSRKIAHF